MCDNHTVLRREYDRTCSIARTLEVLGERWTLLIIRDVFSRRRRFDQIQESLGIARNVLAARLAWLVDEILEKRAYQERPARHEYLLTGKGLELWPVMVTMMHWGDRHLSMAARRWSSGTRTAAVPWAIAASASGAVSCWTRATPTPRPGRARRWGGRGRSP